MFVIGITGGTGTGKTTALNAVEKLGGAVIDCDALYHELLKTDKDLLNAIEAAFPGVVENGELQRKKLGAIVFGDAEKLEALNGITNGFIDRAVRARMRRRAYSSVMPSRFISRCTRTSSGAVTAAVISQ